MHRRPEAKLLPLDTEIENTLSYLKKVRAYKEVTMTEQREGNQNIPVVATGISQQRKRTMEDFWRPMIREEYFVLRQ